MLLTHVLIYQASSLVIGLESFRSSSTEYQTALGAMPRGGEEEFVVPVRHKRNETGDSVSTIASNESSSEIHDGHVNHDYRRKFD